MLARTARLCVAVPRRIIGIAMLLMVAAGGFGIPAAMSLSAGGFVDPTSESARAAATLAEKFNQGDMELVLLVSSASAATDGPARAAGIDIAQQLSQSPFVAQVASPWDAQPAPGLLSSDGKTAMILVALKGNENSAPKQAQALAERFARDRQGITVRAGGSALVYEQVNQQTERDLLRMEIIAIPLSFIALVWVFGGLLAAALPVAVGGLAILGSLAMLRAIALVTNVSIFALNVTVALGFALAIDYTLLIISRYRDELADGTSRDEALVKPLPPRAAPCCFRRLRWPWRWSRPRYSRCISSSPSPTPGRGGGLRRLGGGGGSPGRDCVARGPARRTQRVGLCRRPSAAPHHHSGPWNAPSGTGRRNWLCVRRSRLDWRSRLSCLRWAHRSSASDGAIPTTGYCRHHLRHGTSATASAANSARILRPE